MVKILLFRKKKASPIYGSPNVLIDRVNGSNYRGLRGKRVRKNWIKREKNRWGARNRKQIRSGGRFRRSLSVEKRVMKRENPSIYFELKRYGRRSRKKFLSFFPSFFAKRNSAPIFLTNFQRLEEKILRSSIDFLKVIFVENRLIPLPLKNCLQQ